METWALFPSKPIFLTFWGNPGFQCVVKLTFNCFLVPLPKKHRCCEVEKLD